MSKILRNVSPAAVILFDVGVSIEPGQSYTIPPQDYDKFAASSDAIIALCFGEIELETGHGVALNLSDSVNVLKNWAAVSE